MPPTRSIVARLALGAGLAAAAALAIAGIDDPAADAGRGTPDRCAQADIRDIQLDSTRSIDTVRVVVSRRSPIGGAVDVRVDAGNTDRVVHVRGAISKQLSFSPALQARDLQVSIDPVFSARRGACVERIELISDGVPVATVEP